MLTTTRPPSPVSLSTVLNVGDSSEMSSGLCQRTGQCHTRSSPRVCQGLKTTTASKSLTIFKMEHRVLSIPHQGIHTLQLDFPKQLSFLTPSRAVVYWRCWRSHSTSDILLLLTLAETLSGETSLIELSLAENQ